MIAEKSLRTASHPILTSPEIPEIHIDLVDRPTKKPWGAGEPSAVVASAALSNAVYDAIGTRLRSVPFTSDKVKAAIHVCLPRQSCAAPQRRGRRLLL